MNEEWRPVIGYEGYYEVSDRGRARSLDRPARPGRGNQARRGRILSLKRDSKGHRFFTASIQGEPTHLQVHVEVLTAFVGARPEGLFGLHWDDDPDNNELSNLRWGTPRENNLDTIRNGNNVNAAKTHCARGHEFTDLNTYVWSGGRDCRTCHRDDERDRRARLREERAPGQKEAA